MAEKQKPDPATTTETDISKAVSQQQPPAQAQQDQPKRGEQTGGEAATGEAEPAGAPDEGLEGDARTQQRTDIEGASLGAPEQAEGGFLGSQAGGDTSEQLVEEEQNFGKDGQGAPEGK